MSDVALSTLLWIAWALVAGGGFYLLEVRGMRTGRDRWYTLTNRIRKLQAIHPALRWLIYAIVFGAASWLVAHFAADPLLHPAP